MWSTYPAESPTADKLRFALGWQGPRTAANEGLQSVGLRTLTATP